MAFVISIGAGAHGGDEEIGAIQQYRGLPLIVAEMAGDWMGPPGLPLYMPASQPTNLVSQAIRSRVSILVIDHVERPSEN